MIPLELVFHQPGMLTTIQDAGRSGFQDAGVPVGGPMDVNSAKQANSLVGNPTGWPLFEITLLGPVVEFIGESRIAMTGANLSPSIDGSTVRQNTPLKIQSGSVIRFGKQVSGCRTYLAIAGSIQVPSWLGSVSPVNAPGNPTKQSWIRKGDRISVRPSEDEISSVVHTITRMPEDEEFIYVEAGPEYELFSDLERQRFFEQAFSITPNSNRMGYRLNESITASANDAIPGIISSGVFPGVVQISSSGQPIILMKDAQTSGGYRRIAVVITDQMDRLAQCRPGDRIRFSLV